MSHAAFSHIRDNSKTKGSVKSVLLMIADYANEKNGWIAFPGISRLALDTGFSERTVRQAVKIAIEFGELRRLRRGGFYGGKPMANVYQVVSDFHRQDSPVDQGQDSPVIDEPGSDHRQDSPSLPADSVSPQADSAPPPADLAAQPLVEPEEKKPEEDPEALNLNEFSPEYRTFIEKCRVWSSDDEPENSGEAEEAFHSLLADSHTIPDLSRAYRGASTVGVTDLTQILVADRIQGFVDADPLTKGQQKVAV